MPKTLLSESFPNITDLKLESFRSLWSHCCLFCSCSFLQLLSHLSEITVSLAALIPRYLLSPAGSWHIDFFYQCWSSSLPSQADLSASQQLSCGLPGRGTPQAADSHTLLPTACGERWRVAKLSHILSKPLISGLIFAKICDTNRSLLTWQLVLSNSVPLFPLSILLPYINAVWQNQWSG